MGAGLVWAGCLLIVAGVAFVYWPAAVIAAGLFLAAGGLLIDFEGEQ